MLYSRVPIIGCHDICAMLSVLHCVRPYLCRESYTFCIQFTRWLPVLIALHTVTIWMPGVWLQPKLAGKTSAGIVGRHEIPVCTLCSYVYTSASSEMRHFRVPSTKFLRPWGNGAAGTSACALSREARYNDFPQSGKALYRMWPVSTCCGAAPLPGNFEKNASAVSAAATLGLTF